MAQNEFKKLMKLRRQLKISTSKIFSDIHLLQLKTAQTWQKIARFFTLAPF